MANNNAPAPSFDQFIKEGRKKKAAENLAQKLLGSKGRRSSAPPTGPKAVGLGGSLASRVGVSKPRNSSLPRSGLNTPRAPAARAVPPLQRLRSDLVSDRPSRPSSTRPEVGSRSNSSALLNGHGGTGAGLSIRGAATSAAAPLVIVAQNFAPGTTAADIESVMLKVGGELVSCRLVASTPTVIVEMVFVDPKGADDVIEQFNGKKADGRTLYVYRRDDGGARRATLPATTAAPIEPIPISSEDSAPLFEDTTMLDDETAEARQANDRVREERRGRDDRDGDRLGARDGGRDGGRDVFPSGPRGYRDDAYDRGGPRRSEGGGGGYGRGGGGGYGRGGGGYGYGNGYGGARGGYGGGYGSGGRRW